MFKLDNDFLTSLGLGNLPVEEKNRLLQMIYERLEMNVGMRLAEKMSDQQLDEFETFIDGNIDYARNYLDTNKPGWEQGAEYQKTLETARANAQRQGAQVNENAVISEFAALQWLSTNFPNYKDVVAEELEKLKGEVTQAVPQILASQGQGGQQPQPMQPNVPTQAGFSQQPQQPQQYQQPMQQPYAPQPAPQQYGQPQPQQYQPPVPQQAAYQPQPMQPAQPQYQPQPQVDSFSPVSGQPQQPMYAPQPASSAPEQPYQPPVPTPQTPPATTQPPSPAPEPQYQPPTPQQQPAPPAPGQFTPPPADWQQPQQ